MLFLGDDSSIISSFPLSLFVFSFALLDSPLSPGDKLYPLDTSGKAQVETSTGPQMEDSQGDSTLHRIMILNPYSAALQVTITPKYNHLLPVMEPALSQDAKSQL